MKRFAVLLSALFAAGLLTACGGGADRFTVLQWNIWQEGSVVEGGYDAVVDELVRLRPDLVTLSEVRNYGGVDFTARLCASLAERGVVYHSLRTDDTGLLSRMPLLGSATVFPLENDHGSIHKVVTTAAGREVALYTAHLDWLDDAYYDVRGYDGSTWEPIPVPAGVGEVLARNALSQREPAVRAFIEDARRELAAGRAVFLGGDFNEPSHLDWTEATRTLRDHRGMVVPWPCTSMLEEAGFVDAYRERYPDPVTHPGFTFPVDNPAVEVGRLTWAPEADERDRIDYVFYAPAGSVSLVDAVLFGPEGSIVCSRRVGSDSQDPFLPPLGLWPTDHKGVLVTFEWR